MVVLAIAAIAVGAAMLPGAPARQAALPSVTATLVAESISPSRIATTPVPSTGPAGPSASVPASTRPSSAPPPSTAPARRVHVVQAGDWLSTIAAEYGTTVEELLELNDIADRDVIEVGQEIVLPPTSGP